MKKIRVLFIHHCNAPGGASTSLLNLLRNLPAEKIEAHLITPKGSVAPLFRPLVYKLYELTTRSVSSFFPSAEGIPFLVPKSLLHYVRFYPSLKQIVDITQEVKPDIIHINDIPLIPTAITLHKMGYPVVMHARTAPGKHPGMFDRIQRRWINKHVDKLVCISESVRKGFSDILRTHVVYNPINPEAKGESRSIRKESETLNCVFLSNFLRYKGIYETLDAAIMLKDHPGIHFFFAGSNIRSPKFYQSLTGRILDRLNIVHNIEGRLKKQILRHGLTNVTMLGHVHDIDTLLQRMHVNLAPVRLNAPPRSVFEAAMHEVPTVLALTDIVEDLVSHEKTGLIIPPRDPVAIRDAILKLYGDEHLRSTMGRNARLKLTAQHDPVLGAERILSLYNEILKTKQPGRVSHEVIV